MARKQRKWIGWFFALVILVVLAAGAYQFYLHFRFPVTGIDVSHHNGAIDWPRVKDQGYYFAFIKATEGRTLVDEDFSNHQAGARKVGMLTGAYHYFLPDLDAKAQAQHFLKIAKPKSGDLRPVLDVEETRGKSAAEIQKGVRIWLETV